MIAFTSVVCEFREEVGVIGVYSVCACVRATHLNGVMSCAYVGVSDEVLVVIEYSMNRMLETSHCVFVCLFELL